MKWAERRPDIETTMSAAAHPQTRTQALPSLLLEQISRRDPGDRPSAADRLEQQLGSELAARLVSALAGDHAVRRWLVAV
jgi:hypothetical protein